MITLKSQPNLIPLLWRRRGYYTDDDGNITILFNAQAGHQDRQVEKWGWKPPQAELIKSIITDWSKRDVRTDYAHI